MSEEGPLEYIGKVFELNQISIAMGDPDLTDALDKVVKIIANPNVGPQSATRLVVQLQAYAVEFRMKAKYYMLFNKEGDATRKKNTYLTLADSLSSLCDSLKYLARNYSA